MPFECVTPSGKVVISQRPDGRWFVTFRRRHAGDFASATEAAEAVAGHRSGIDGWDTLLAEAPRDLLDWTPTGDSI